MPGGSGIAAGSSYPDFIKSRLYDAMKVTSSYSSKNPEVVVRLTISADGKIFTEIERSSGDAIYETAVRRAITLASEKFDSPPNHNVFITKVTFNTKGISIGSSR